MTKTIEIENIVTTNHDHDKYITSKEFNKLALLQNSNKQV